MKATKSHPQTLIKGPLVKGFIFPQLETNSLPPRSNSTQIYSSLSLSNGFNPWSTFFSNTTPPWYVTISNFVCCVWRICFPSVDQMHNKALWQCFLFKHGSYWCVSFTCLSFCSCETKSQAVEEKTLTNKLSIVFFSTSISFSSFALPSADFNSSSCILSFSISPSAYVDSHWLVLVS